MIYQRITEILKRCESENPVMPPTHLYNEGWMLCLVLDWLASTDSQSLEAPVTVPQGCRWYVEALLPSAFLPEYRGDPRAETWTHADGVIGEFDIGNEGRADLSLKSNARHFVAIEAKMFSRLSAGCQQESATHHITINLPAMWHALQKS